MRRFCLIFSVVLVAFAGCARAASTEQFRFQDLEYYYLHYYLPPASDDPEQTQLKNYAVKYAEAHFPLGSSASAAVSALTMAGAKCSVGDDPNEPPLLFATGQGELRVGLFLLSNRLDGRVGDRQKIRDNSRYMDESHGKWSVNSAGWFGFMGKIEVYFKNLNYADDKLTIMNLLFGP